MTTAVGVMDAPGFDANTDVLVLVDPQARRLLWVPRDLWCQSIRDRVNQAFALGGHEGIALALRDHGLEPDAIMVVARAAAERVLDGIAVEVEVPDPLEFWYPLDPRRPIEDGRKRIRFEPPAELLEGERLHQWIGARYRVHGPGSDLDRIRRQRILVTALLERSVEWGRALQDPDEVAISGPALEELRLVDAGFSTATFADDAVPRTIDGKDVLVR
jgi:anionic cell wall polymer biosynthesis LytR-Cps2A-Psr (LCP) family protein